MNHSPTFTTTEYVFLKYLGASLHKFRDFESLPQLSEGELAQVIALANRHEDIALVGDVLDQKKHLMKCYLMCRLNLQELYMQESGYRC